MPSSYPLSVLSIPLLTAIYNSHGIEITIASDMSYMNTATVEMGAKSVQILYLMHIISIIHLDLHISTHARTLAHTHILTVVIYTISSFIFLLQCATVPSLICRKHSV